MLGPGKYAHSRFGRERQEVTDGVASLGLGGTPPGGVLFGLWHCRVCAHKVGHFFDQVGVNIENLVGGADVLAADFTLQLRRYIVAVPTLGIFLVEVNVTTGLF